MSHIKEPWFVVDAPWGDGTWINSGSPDPHRLRFVADCEDISGDVEKDVARFNARRIVACVNACAGYPIEQIEEYAAIGGFHANALSNFHELMEIMRQRDDLLAALQCIVDANPRKWDELSEPQSEFERWAKSRANHAIARVKGGAA